MLQLLCFQAASEQCISNRLVHPKLFCVRECKSIWLMAELPFQYSSRQYENSNIMLLPENNSKPQF